LPELPSLNEILGDIDFLDLGDIDFSDLSDIELPLISDSDIEELLKRTEIEGLVPDSPGWNKKGEG